MSDWEVGRFCGSWNVHACCVVLRSQSFIILLYPPTGDTKVQSVFRHGIAAGSAGRVPLARLSRHHATSVAHILPRPSSPAAVRVLAHISWVLCRPSAPSRCCAAASACRLWAASPLSSLPESFARRPGHANVQVVLVVDGDGEAGRRCRCARRGVLARAAPPSPPPRCRLSCRCWRSSGAGWPGAFGTWPGASRARPCF